MLQLIPTLALKDLKLLVRDKPALFWIGAFPLMFALFFGAVLGGDRPRGGLAVAVIDEDQSAASRAYVARLGQSEALRLVTDLDQAAAAEQVRKGALTAFVVIPKGFGTGSLFAGKPQVLRAGIDPARKAEGGFLEGILLEGAYAGLQEQFFNPKMAQNQLQQFLEALDRDKTMNAERRGMLKVGLGLLAKGLENLGQVPDGGGDGGRPKFEPFRLERVAVTREDSRPRSAFEISFPSAVLWGMLGCVAAFSISLVTERTEGTLLRLKAAPLGWAPILAGKALACFTTCVTVAALLLVGAWAALGVRVESPAGLVLAVGSAAWCFTGLTMFVSTLGTTQGGVAGAGWGIMMPLAMLGGGMVPLIAMPAWMQTASNVSPVKWGILALEGAIWRGFGLGDMVLPCAILLGVGALAFAAGVRSLARGGV